MRDLAQADPEDLDRLRVGPERPVAQGLSWTGPEDLDRLRAGPAQPVAQSLSWTGPEDLDRLRVGPAWPSLERPGPAADQPAVLQAQKPRVSFRPGQTPAPEALPEP